MSTHKYFTLGIFYIFYINTHLNITYIYISMSYTRVEIVYIVLYRYTNIDLFKYLILLISITYKIFINLFKLFIKV